MPATQDAAVAEAAAEAVAEAVAHAPSSPQLDLKLVPSTAPCARQDRTPATTAHRATAHRAAAQRALDPGPRARLARSGAEALSDAELVAILLGGDETRAFRTAQSVIGETGGLHALAHSDLAELICLPGISKVRSLTLLAAAELGKRVSVPKDLRQRPISSPADADALLRPRLQHLEQENFVVVLLNTKNVPLSAPTISVGTLSSSLVHPREVFKPAVRAAAAGVILAHNHPSGDTRPSTEDRTVTDRLVKAGEIFGIEVLDHLIIGNSYYSMKEHGHL